MKPTLKSRFPLLLTIPLALLLSAPVRGLAQEHPASASAPKTASSGEHMEEPETKSQLEAFRHSDSVKALARRLNLSVETTARIIEIFNSALIIGAIAWLVFSVVPKAFRKRNDTLQKQLLEARLAATEANERLAVVEERLSKLGVEIDAIRLQTERDMVEDEKRIHESLEAERHRIVASAEQEIEAAGAAAQRDLRKFAAQLAVNRARQEIRIGPDDDRALIRSFGESLNGGRN
ncbi:MAG TPA: ATP synthase F0 subunit B [Silvibacterium sp.]|nr:ATP synthase F0 subunit B [Silvibacterium sp.]